MAFFLNDASVASSSDDKTILLWNALTGQRSGTLALRAGIGSLAFDRDNSRCVAGAVAIPVERDDRPGNVRDEGALRADPGPGLQR